METEAKQENRSVITWETGQMMTCFTETEMQEQMNVLTERWGAFYECWYDIPLRQPSAVYWI